MTTVIYMMVIFWYPVGNTPPIHLHHLDFYSKNACEAARPAVQSLGRGVTTACVSKV